MAKDAAAPIITVKRSWDRPDPALVDRFRDAPSGNVSDAANRGNSLDPSIKPVTPEFRFCGTALTVDAGKHDNLAFWAALDKVQAGDVMMVATQGHRDCAVIGDLIVSFARNRGCVAVVTDGMIRDVEALGELGIPVFSAGIRPSGPDKKGPGSVGLPVWVAGQRVDPGDIVVGDRDGVVVVPQAMAAEAADTLDQIAEKEAGMEADGGHARALEPLGEPASVEEVGELARLLNHEFGHKPKKDDEVRQELAEELADVLFVILVMANERGIDLDAALVRTLEKYRRRDSDRWTRKDPST